MSKTSPTDMKAIAWFSETENLIPQLSTPPDYYFKHRETGEEKKYNLIFIRGRYDAQMAETKKEAAAERKRAREAEKRAQKK